MKKINLCIPLKTVLGENMRDGTKAITLMNTIVANQIAGAKGKKNAIRQWEVALKIAGAKGEMELEDADFELMKEAIKESGSSVIIMGQILKVIERSESKK